MKTVQEQAKELLDVADNISLFEATLEEMKLEAWKQGMTDAAKICDNGWSNWDSAMAIRQASDEKQSP